MLCQDAVKTVLRKHQIKPHWMFALDNLVGSAIQAVILVLSPELGPHLVPGNPHLEEELEEAGPEDDVDMDTGTGAESTSGVSTVNTGQDQQGGGGAEGGAGGAGQHSSTQRMVTRLRAVREDNRQLLADLLRAQTSYHQLLQQSLAEQKLHLQMLSQNLASSSLQPPAPGLQPTPARDQPLVSWLHDLAIDDRSVEVFVCEDLTLNDVLELMSRDDLKRLGLKVRMIPDKLVPS